MCWFGILAVNLHDIIDWIILRYGFKKDPILHPLGDKFRDKFFSWLPDLREKKWTVINEILLMVLLGIGIYVFIAFSGFKLSGRSANSSTLFKTPIVKGFPQTGQILLYFFDS